MIFSDLYTLYEDNLAIPFFSDSAKSTDAIVGRLLLETPDGKSFATPRDVNQALYNFFLEVIRYADPDIPRDWHGHARYLRMTEGGPRSRNIAVLAAMLSGKFAMCESANIDDYLNRELLYDILSLLGQWIIPKPVTAYRQGILSDLNTLWATALNTETE